MDCSFKIEGLDEMFSKVKKSSQSVYASLQKELHDEGLKLSKVMKQKAVFTKGYSTGATRKSIRLINRKDSVTVGPRTDYAPYLEFGTRFMEAQPFVKPAIDEIRPDFEKTFRKLVENSLK